MNDERAVVVVGLGLVGGSVARRLSERGWKVGWVDPGVSPDEVRPVAPALEVAELNHLADWPLVLLATPTGTAIDLLRKLETGDAIVTSVCSVMEPLTRVATERSIFFVAGHPMAGREVKGWSHSTADLFVDRPWFRADNADDLAVSRVDELIAECGSVVVPMDPTEHDRHAAVASHLPQLLSSALAALIDESDIPEPFLGPGLRTFLRLAGSSWSMWEPVFEHNDAAVADAKAALDDLVRRVRSGDGETIFRAANELHRKLS